MNRRNVLKVTTAAPLAMIDPARTGQGVDPAVTAFKIACDAEDASTAAYEQADAIAPPSFVRVNGEAAFTPEGIDRLVSRYTFRQAFARTVWPEGSRTPAQEEQHRIEREATAGPIPDAHALKAELAENQRQKAEAFQGCQVEKAKQAFRDAQQALIDTPATSLAGVVAKLRFAVGIEATAIAGDAESELIHGAIADAERLAKS